MAKIVVETGCNSLGNAERIKQLPRRFKILTKTSSYILILNNNRTKYSDKDLLHIRDWLYTIAEVTIHIINDYVKKNKLNELHHMLNKVKKKREKPKERGQVNRN